MNMSITAAIVVIVAGLLIAALLNGLIGTIVAAVGLVGLIVAVVNTTRASA
jgi:Na+/H+-translocating membrane pyrophosphatase